jgi:hypothetical protein
MIKPRGGGIDNAASNILNRHPKRDRDTACASVPLSIPGVDAPHAGRRRRLPIGVDDDLANIGGRGIEDFAWQLGLQCAPRGATIHGDDKPPEPSRLAKFVRQVL